MTAIPKFLLMLSPLLMLVSCDRNAIEFGDTPENGYTNLVFTDTISINMSTVIQDSFVTSSATSLLLGSYADPALGTVTAKNYFQLKVPEVAPTIADGAVYDSLTLIIRPNDYYYGDTTIEEQIIVSELADPIAFTYNSQLYNTSTVAVNPVPLGSKSLKVKPVTADSIQVKLADAKGQDLFQRLKAISTTTSNQEEFINYFKGLSLSTGPQQAAVFGLNGAAGSILMRLHYHTSSPYPESHYVDFPSMANSYSFNHIATDRTGTGLVTGASSVTEIPSSLTQGRAYLQQGTGLFLKMTFPALHSLVNSGKLIRLVKAELYVRPTYLSFDNNKYKLPASLTLAQTDASNLVGSSIMDSTGVNPATASPVTDALYGENSYYRFNITSYINYLMTTAGSEKTGLYIQHASGTTDMNVNRLVLNNPQLEGQSSKLLLYMIVVNP